MEEEKGVLDVRREGDEELGELVGESEEDEE